MHSWARAARRCGRPGATLTTLGERLHPGEAEDLAAPLPMEVDRFVADADSGQSFDYGEFTEWVAERAGVEESDAGFYAKVVVDVVDDAIPEGELDDVTAQLPAEFDPLFELTETGSYYE